MNFPTLSVELLIVIPTVITLEATMEKPVDVECAYAGGELYLLQCHPITTLR